MPGFLVALDIWSFVFLLSPSPLTHRREKSPPTQSKNEQRVERGQGGEGVR